MRMIWFIILCITLISKGCLIFMKYHQLTLKFNTLNKFYKDIKKLEDVKKQSKGK